MTKRIFSGVQPTGGLHLGNYLGAIRNWVALQGDYDCLFCVVDMHAITVWQDPETLRQGTFEVAAALIAAGIDPETNALFNQSQNPAHAELAWVCNCVARLGWLNRMTQFKEKAGENKENASVGLYAYPNLMAADILVYKATHVPVGEDQKQHLELTRDIAAKFNNDHGVAFFPIPEPLIPVTARRVMSLKNAGKKMSKSDPSDLSRINLADDADAIVKKIRKAKTDPGELPATADDLEGRPEARNLMCIYAALADEPMSALFDRFGGRRFSDFKAALADLAVEKLGPVRDELARLMDDRAHVEGVLAEGAAKAREISEPIMKDLYDIVGFLRPGRP